MDVLKVVVLLTLLVTAAVAKVCPGYCVPPDLCTSHGGNVLGYCVNGRACCDARHDHHHAAVNRSSCGTEVRHGNDSNSKTAIFLSPDYPGHSSGNLICPFDVRLDPETVGVELELIRFELDGKEIENQGIRCDADLFFVKGFAEWVMDPKCGRLNGYSVLIDLDEQERTEKITLLFITSSKEFRWKIRIHQISRKKLAHSESCIKKRHSQWQSTKEYPKSFRISDRSPFRPGPADSRWKWEVDIVSTEARPANCEGTNNTLPLPWHRLCKGTIIDDRHVVTSASCFLRQPNIERLHVATSAFCPVEPKTVREQLYDILGVAIHYNYQPKYMTNDIAVIRTKKSISFGENVQPLAVFQSSPPAILVHSLSKQEDRSMEASELHQDSVTECQNDLREYVGLSNKSLSDLRGTRKHSSALENLICGPLDQKIIDPTCPEEIQSLVGYPLVGLHDSGVSPELAGYLVMAVKDHVHEDHHYVPLYHAHADLGSYRVYFYTLVDSIRRWIYIAVA